MPLSPEDITALYERHMKMVYRLCFSYLRNAADTEDAVQNVFIKAMGSGVAFNDSEHEKAWLIRCSANHCKDVLKSAYKARTDFAPPPEVGVYDDQDASYSEVLEAVLDLPEKYKDCVYLHYYEGYKTDEIARITERTPSTVRSHLSEARALLRERLGGGRL